jgi:aminoglycoside phosphotransferase (APT) family kinase protein
MTMHAGEVHVDVALVEGLVADQFPDLAGLAVSGVPSTGTVNAIFRLGDRLCARLPRLAHWADDLDREWKWLPRLAPHLPLRIPAPVVRGAPSAA